MKLITNQEIAKIFYEMAALYEMADVPFKPQAYEKAAMAIAALDNEVMEIYQKFGREGLQQIPGVGASLAQHLESILKTGTFEEYEKYKKKIPVNLAELMAIEGLGPKKIKILFQKLKIKNLQDLEKAAQAHKIQKLPHFGPRSEEKILKGIEFYKKGIGRFLLGYLEPLVESIENRLRQIPGVGQVTTAGSYRRRQETIGDIDILVTAKDPEKVMNFFVSLPEVEEVLAKGETKSMVRLKNGIQADLRVVEEKSYGSALQYFTGSKEHNIALRKIALAKGLKLNEYGVFKGKKQIAGRSEEEVYQSLGLVYLEPELRTNSGEIEAALREAQGKTPGLPKLISYNSIRGDLQVQTNWSDGHDSIETMAKAAKEAGLEYMAITDHTKSLAMTGGLDERKLAQQGKEIDKLNEKFQKLNFKFRILKSAEVNILKDGRLDINDEALKKLDVVAVAVHSHFHLPEEEQTKRIIKALKHPLVNILFHPTGRVIGQREPYALDIAKIIRAAKEYGVALEIDAYPDRLDLKDTHIRQAVEAGVKLVIDSDAHSILHFKFYNLGIAQARRGWATQADILNTLSCHQFLEAIKKLKRK
jgi:DNA polymerase (family 10)